MTHLAEEGGLCSEIEHFLLTKPLLDKFLFKIKTGEEIKKISYFS